MRTPVFDREESAGLCSSCVAPLAGGSPGAPLNTRESIPGSYSLACSAVAVVAAPPLWLASISSGAICASRVKYMFLSSLFAFERGYDIVTSALSSNIDRCYPVIILFVRVGAMLNEFLDNRKVRRSSHDSPPKWCIPKTVNCINVRASFEQNPHNFLFVVPRGEMQRRPLLIKVRCIDVSSMLNEQTH